MIDAVGGMAGLADRLNHLFATVPRPDGGGSWTNEKAAAALHALGTGMSDGYLSQLRNGRKTNPSARHLAAIGELFGVPVDYFFDLRTAERMDADLPLLVAFRDPEVRRLALRAYGLSPESIASLIGIIDQARRFEHLPAMGSRP